MDPSVHVVEWLQAICIFCLQTTHNIHPSSTLAYPNKVSLAPLLVGERQVHPGGFRNFFHLSVCCLCLPSDYVNAVPPTKPQAESTLVSDSSGACKTIAELRLWVEFQRSGIQLIFPAICQSISPTATRRQPEGAAMRFGCSHSLVFTSNWVKTDKSYTDLSRWHGFRFSSTALRRRLPGGRLGWERLIMPG